MANDNQSQPAEPAGSLDLPWQEIPDGTVSYVLNSFRSNLDAVAIRHPSNTITCDEKLEMFAQHQELYAPYGKIRIAKSIVLLLVRKHLREHALFLCDSEDRMDTKQLKQFFSLQGKKEDLRICSEDIESIVGLPRGGVSPLVPDGHRLSYVVFDQKLHDRERDEPDVRWDWAFDLDRSILLRPSALFASLELHPPVSQIIKWTPRSHLGV